MTVAAREAFVRTAVAAAALAVAALMPGATQAQAQATYVMKMSTPTLNDVPDTFGKEFGAMVEKDSGGRIKAELYPASQLGAIPRQIEGTQFGAIQCTIIPPEFFVGVDERFEVMAAPGLVDSLAHGQRVAADPDVLKLMLSLGANKGLHGVGMFMAEAVAVVSRAPIRHIDDFKGKKIRIFASDFQKTAFERLGVTPVAMTLGDVLPALQQGAIDGAVTGIGPVVHMHFQDAAKYLTATNQSAIYLMVEISQKWYDTLPKDLQDIVDRDAAAEAKAINTWAIEHRKRVEGEWTASGAELIRLPPDEQAKLMKTLGDVGQEVSKTKPAVAAAYQVVTGAAQRLR
jgi:TRAP-type C4-dicarboxylate transport system substrate-binding protein